MPVSKRLRYEILRRDNHACKYCGATAPDVKVTIDHVLPVALGGTDTPDNLVTACADCNSGKTSTTPDAPLVADVAEDALRWAGAMSIAAQEALEDTQNRDKTYKAFRAAWKEHGGYDSDLPDNWRGSLKSLIAAGLPPEAIAECVAIAFDQAHVYDRNRFKYTCGVAWRKVDKLRKRAGEIVGMQRVPASEPEAEDDGWEVYQDADGLERDFPITALSVCDELLDTFTGPTSEEIVARASKNWGNAPESVVKYAALEESLQTLAIQWSSLKHALDEVSDAYSQHEITRCADEVHMENPSLSEVGFLVSVIRRLTAYDRSKGLLSRLPSPEQEQWTQAARDALGDEADERDIVVEASRRHQEATTSPPPF